MTQLNTLDVEKCLKELYSIIVKNQKKEKLQEEKVLDEDDVKGRELKLNILKIQTKNQYKLNDQQ